MMEDGKILTWFYLCQHFSDDNNILKLLKSKNIKIVNQIGGNCLF